MKSNLKMMMNLLRDKSANIQFEAFHVFKVFVANPKKPDDIRQILLANKEKLITYLQNFHSDKGERKRSVTLGRGNIIVTSFSVDRG